MPSYFVSNYPEAGSLYLISCPLTLFLIQGICDGLMNHLSLLLSSSIPSETISAQQRSCVTYTLSSLDSGEHDPPSISLLESRNLVAAAGTTGLRTWESALHLGEYLCANSQSLVHGRSILELGAGTAYVSILCARHLRASNVIATDGSEDVVASLTDNFLLNGLQDGAIIQGKELKWGQPLVSDGRPECNGDRRVDLVLGADITFDESANAALVSTFRDIFDLSPDVKFILAAPVRNPKTFDLFLEACRRNGYKLEEIEFGTKTAKLQTGPFYADKVPIRLCLIIKS
jgi:predicted nicotinamide N-methyase